MEKKLMHLEKTLTNIRNKDYGARKKSLIDLVWLGFISYELL